MQRLSSVTEAQNVLSTRSYCSDAISRPGRKSGSRTPALVRPVRSGTVCRNASETCGNTEPIDANCSMNGYTLVTAIALSTSHERQLGASVRARAKLKLGIPLCARRPPAQAQQAQSPSLSLRCYLRLRATLLGYPPPSLSDTGSQQRSSSRGSTIDISSTAGASTPRAFVAR